MSDLDSCECPHNKSPACPSTEANKSKHNTKTGKEGGGENIQRDSNNREIQNLVFNHLVKASSDRPRQASLERVFQNCSATGGKTLLALFCLPVHIGTMGNTSRRERQNGVKSVTRGTRIGSCWK